MSSPPRKKSKADVAASKIDQQPDGVIRFELDDVTAIENNDLISPEVEVKGVPWRAVVQGREMLYVGLQYMATQCTPWSIDVYAEFTLVHSDNKENLTKNGKHTFNNRELPDYHCGQRLVDLEEFIEDKKEFIKDGKFTVEIRLWIKKMTGVRIVPRMDFTDSDHPSHDVALVIDDEKIYVSKQYLSLHSPVFNAMFHGNFSEKNKKEIVLKDVDRKEFIDFLHVFYPSCRKITVDSAEYLLKLGDQFQIACVINRVEEYAISDKTLSDTEMLRIADQYRLNGLMKRCLSGLTTKHDFKAIQESSIYNGLSSDTKDALFRELLEVAK